MKIYLILTVIILLGLSVCDERTFSLKSGDKVTGEVINIDESGNYTVKTSMGDAVFNQDDIILENVKIVTNDGDRIIGVLMNEDNNKFNVKTNIGLMSINKNNINLIEFNYDDYGDDSDEGFLNNLSKSENRFYFGDEQLIDVWFDPTGNVLTEGTIYMSGFSGAYGVTEKFHISLRVWDFILGNVNFRPKYQVYKKGDLEKSNSLSIGAHIYLTGAVVNKWEVSNDICEEDECVGYRSSWRRITSDEFSYEMFIAHTSSKLKPSGQGRINYNIGFSIAQVGGYAETMPRIWFGTDIDVRKSLKLTGLIAYDPYLPTLAEFFRDENNNDIHLDFGFIYAMNESFRFGLHLTSPFIGFYWKF